MKSFFSLLLFLCTCVVMFSLPAGHTKPQRTRLSNKTPQLVPIKTVVMPKDPSSSSMPFMTDLSIALVVPTTIKDHAWSESMYASLQQVKNSSPDLPAITFSVKENIASTDKLNLIVDYAITQGANFVIAHSPTFKNAAIELAKKYPHITFAVSAEKQYTPDYTIPSNLYLYRAAEEEAGYVNGVIAALSVDLATVGFIVPESGITSIVNNYIEGFRNGLFVTSPASSTRVNYVNSPWTIRYSSEAASLLVLNDVELLTGVFPQAIGAIHSAEMNQIPWLGVEYNQTSVAPHYVLASQVYHWEPVLREIFLAKKNGVSTTEVFTINFANGGIETVYNKTALKNFNTIYPFVEKVTASIIQGIIDPLGDEIGEPDATASYVQLRNEFLR